LIQSFSTKEDKEEHFEAIGLLLRMADELPIDFDTPSKRHIAAFEFLHRKISFDYFSQFNDYASLFYTFEDIKALLPLCNDHQNPSQELFNLLSLLVIQLSAIFENRCTEFFDQFIIRSIRPFLIFLILEHFDFDFRFKPFVMFILEQPSSTSRLISRFIVLGISYKIRSFFKYADRKYSSLLQKFKYRKEINSFDQILNCQFDQLKGLLIEGSSLDQKEVWILKGLIEIKQYLNPLFPKLITKQSTLKYN
jgi:hypothetical protein